MADDIMRMAYESIPADMRPETCIRAPALDTDRHVVICLPGQMLWVYDTERREGCQVHPREVWRVGLECVLGDDPNEWEASEN